MNSLEAHEYKMEDNWLDILGSGQLKKKIIKNGNGNSPEVYCICVVSYEGRLLDRTIVDKEDHIQIQLGDFEVVEGLDLALAYMNVDEKAVLLIAPRLGYGTLGRLPHIGPNETLEYTVELHSEEPEPELRSYTIEERKNTGITKRARGNWWFSRKQPGLAIRCYRRALYYLDEQNNETERESTGLHDLLDERVKVHNNLAAALIEMDEFGSALESVDYVLRYEPNNIKALFRKGKIFLATGLYERAFDVFNSASRLEPANKAIKQELIKTKNLKKRDAISEKSLCKNMFRNDVAKAKTESDDQLPKKSFPWGWVLGGTTAVVVGVAAYRYFW